jgi:hypothetical protein
MKMGTDTEQPNFKKPASAQSRSTVRLGGDTQSQGSIWLMQSMQKINDLTPNITGKAFDPDWFLLREHLQYAATIMDSATKERLPIAYRWWNERNQCWDYDNDSSNGAQPLYEAP